MDLHFTANEPAPAEVSAVDGVLGPPVSSWSGGTRDIELEGHASSGGHSARADRHLLLPVLHAIHSRIGWISPGALNYACKRLNIPPADAYGVAGFYALFSVTPRAPDVVHVCDDIACQSKGAAKLCERLTQTLGPPGESTNGGGRTWLRSPCLGLCERAPAALLSSAGEQPRERVFAPTDAEQIAQELQGASESLHGDSPDTFRAELSVPQAGQPHLKLLKRIGTAEPESLDDYRSHGGYQALEKALELGPEWVIQQLLASNLLGRGGAAFPAGRKWQAVAAAKAPKYVVCNADESEPGTFKDRILMEGDPFAVIEAMTIAAFATGCEKGYIYIRGEYPLATERLLGAIEAARQAGLLGNKVSGRDFPFEIELRRGAGAYICGEETALFNSIEGYRGEPRNKPPYPTDVGLFGRPTLVNNVETLANVPLILLEGGEAYTSIGTKQSAGPKLFCLSGHVERPGVYEAEFGATVRELIDLAGGVSGSGRLQAVLVGGAAGALISPSELDTPFTFEGMRAVGATLGSAVAMPFDDTVDLRKILLRIAAFFRDESCGQCVPCRVGAVRQEELLRRLEQGRPLGSFEEEVKLLKEIGQAMRDASICGLGQTASSAVESAFHRFPIFQ